MTHLILAEKPTAAKKIAECILDDYKTKKIGTVSYYESAEGIIVASAVGHLFTLKDKKRKEYPNFELEWQPSFKKSKFTKSFYDALEILAKESDKITIATDLDIEGEVIGYNVYRFLFEKAKVSRMEFSTLTKDELKQSFENRKEGYNKGMTESGLTRHYLDYFYGVNISKALTSSVKTASDRYYLLSSGRVQGPALAILAERENEISKFVPIPYWELNFITKKSDKRKFEELIFNYKKSKFWEKDEADKVFNECDKKDAVIKNIEGKKKILNPPIPFNLTGLQMEAYKVFGYTPSRTQQIAQGLYIGGLISYPRTSSQKLPPSIDYKKIIKKLCRRFKAGEELLKKKLTPTEGKKSDSAHPAIYPTGDLPKKLGEVESKLYSLIVHRFFAVFGEPAERLSVKVSANIGEHDFHCTGAKTIKANWLSLYPYARLQEIELPDFARGEILKVDKLNLEDKETQPPKRYSQASLVKELEKRNLGTKSTRASIVQTLYDRNYIETQQIKVTNLGMHIVETLEKYAPDFLSEELTAKFEKEMELVEQDEKKREDVLEDVKKLLTKTFDKFRKNEMEIGKALMGSVEETIEEQSNVGVCDKCGGNLKFIQMWNGSRFVGCSNYPKCKNGYPLPRNCGIEKTGKICEHCGTPILKIIRRGMRPFNMCLDTECKSKENWGKKKKKGGKKTAVKKTKTTKAKKTAVKKISKVVKKPAIKKTTKAKKKVVGKKVVETTEKNEKE